MKIRILLLAFLFLSSNAFACLSAKQHKLFPIGVIDDNIVFVEAHIYRTEDINKEDKERHALKVKWIIKSYVTIYDKSHNLISQTEIEKEETKGDSYIPLLQSTYTKGLFQIKSTYKDLEYFKVDYLSFCDYQKKCKRLEIQNDTINNKDTFKYKKLDFPIKLSDDQKNKESATFVGNLYYYFLNSIRVYKTDNLELVIGHLATGHQVSMGWITADPSKTHNENGEPVHKAKPYLPDFEFDDVYTAVYQEPIMHHGYGFDLFIIKDY